MIGFFILILLLFWMVTYFVLENDNSQKRVFSPSSTRAIPSIERKNDDRYAKNYKSRASYWVAIAYII